MQQTRRELLDDLLDFMGELGDADARNTAERLLSRVIQTIWLKKNWTDHRMPDPYQFSTVAGTRTYVLPDYFGRVAGLQRYLRNVTTGTRIEPIGQEDLEDAHPEAGTALESSAAPSHYFIGGTQGVHTQPASTGEALEVVSTSAADTQVRATVEGLDANGIWTSSTVLLTGVGAVPVGTFAKVINFAKAYKEDVEPTTEGTSSEGSVMLRKAGGGAELEKLQPVESAHERLTLTLFRKPDSAYLIAVPVVRAPRRLYRDSDEVPRFWGPAIFEEARLEFDLNQGNINQVTFIQAPRPRLRELVEFDNALAYSDLRIQPFTL